MVQPSQQRGQEQPHPDILEGLRQTGRMALVVDDLGARGYRLLAHVPGSAGNRALGLFEAVSVFLVYPGCVQFWPPLDRWQAANASTLR